MRQEVRFATSRDGTRIAWAQHGHGPPLVRVATWLTNLESDWTSPIWNIVPSVLAPVLLEFFGAA